MDNPLKHIAILSGIGIQMLAIIVLGTFVGVKMDEAYPNEKNIFTLIIVFISVIMSIYYVIRRVTSVSKK